MISSVYAACSDGTAATGFAYSDPRSYSPSNEKARNGTWPEIGPISRVVGSSSPSRLASHGGAAGKSAKVANAIPARSATQAT